MRSALFLPLFGELADPSIAVDLAVAAEAAGWDGLFVWDHVAYRAPVQDIAGAWTVLAAVATTTERLVLGPMVTPLARRRPQVLARQCTSIDQLSHGRFVLGVGLGMDTSGGELSSFGEELDPRARAQLLDQRLELLDAWWRGEMAMGLHLLPRPVQAPRIPVWVASQFPNRAPARRAARWDGWFPIGVEDPDRLGEQLAWLLDQRAAGAGPFDVAVRGEPDADPAPWAAAGATWWLVGFEPWDPKPVDVRAVIAAGPPTVTPSGHVAIVGTTASGKSALAMALAGEDPTFEIVSVDSMQVYRGMDIGTAKPTPAEQAAVPHHLVDLVEPSDDFTVTRFQAAATAAIAAIEARGHRALLVGGTGLYLQAVVDGLTIPGRWPAVRAELETTAGEPGGLARLHERLTELDPRAASRMEPTNRRRVVRALEVTIGSGRPYSGHGPGLDAYPPTPIRQLAVALPLDVVRARIARRYARQLAGGFVDEVRSLAAGAGGLSRTARQALGYRELLEHVERGRPLDEVVAEAVVRTGRFARRQRAWFRRDPRIEWLAADADPMDLLPSLRAVVAGQTVT